MVGCVVRSPTDRHVAAVGDGRPATDGAGAEEEVVDVDAVAIVDGCELEGYVLSFAGVVGEIDHILTPGGNRIELHGIDRCEGVDVVGVVHHANDESSIAIGGVYIGAIGVESEHH